MKTERAIELLHRISDSQFDGIHGDERREALDMAVRALEGDGDTISRQAAMVVFENSGLDDDSKDTVVRVLEQLPSAQPQRKKGKWIPVDSFSAFGGDEAMWMAHGNPVAFYYCSECKEQAYAGEDGESLLTDFCPFCGAYMRGENDD